MLADIVNVTSSSNQQTLCFNAVTYIEKTQG